MTSTEVLFRLEADPSGALRGFTLSREELEKLRRTTDQAGDQAAKTSRQTKQLGDATEKTGKQARTTSATMRSLKTAVAAVFTVATLRQATLYADTIKEINARIKIATDSEWEYQRARQATFEISQQTSTALESTVELYARLELALKDTNTAQDEILRVTELVNKAMVTSGASVQEANAAVIQLAQGLASGALRGDEFRSVAEQTPRILQALQASLGKTRGELKEMADQGELTTEIIMTALLEQGAALDAEFAEIPLTVGRAFTQLRNEALRWVGEADEATGASARLAEAILWVADSLEHLANVAIAGAVAGLAVVASKLIAVGAGAVAAGVSLTALLNPFVLIAAGVGVGTLALLEFGKAEEEVVISTGKLVGAMHEAESAFEIRAAIQRAREGLEALKAEADDLSQQFIDLEDDEVSIFKEGIFGKSQAEIDAEKRVILNALDEIDRKEAELNATLDEGYEKLDKLAGQTRTNISLTNEYADAVALATKAVLAHGTVEQKVAILKKQYAEAVRALATELPKTAEGEDLLRQAVAAMGRELEGAIKKTTEGTDKLVVFKTALAEAEAEAADAAEAGLMRLEMMLEEIAMSGELTAEEIEELRDRIRLLRLRLEEVPESTEEVTKGFDSMTESLIAAARRVDDLFAQVWTNIWTGAEDAFDGVKRLAQSMMAEISHALLTRPLSNQIMGWISGIGLSSASGTAAASTGAASGATGAAAGAAGPLAAMGPYGWIAIAALVNAGLATSGWAAGDNPFGYSDIAKGSLGNFAIPVVGELIGASVFATLIGDKIFQSLGLNSEWASILSGSAISNALFGHKAPKLQSLGLEGALTFGGFEGEWLQNIKSKGGLFRSDKKWTETGAVPDTIQELFDSIFGDITDFSSRLGKRIGLDVGELMEGYSQQISLTLDKDPEVAEQQLQAYVEGITEEFINAIAGTFGEGIQGFVAAADSADEQLRRLATATDVIEVIQDNIELGERSFSEFLAVSEEIRLAGETSSDALGRLLEAIENIVALKANIEAFATSDARADFGEYLRQQTMTAADAVNEYADSIFELRDNFTGSVDDLTRLNELSALYRQAEMVALIELYQLAETINTGFYSLKEQATRDLLGDEAYYGRNEARIEELADSLPTLTDPRAIAAVVAEIQRLSNVNYNLLSDEGRAARAGDLLAFIEKVESYGRTAFDAARADEEAGIYDQGDDVRDVAQFLHDEFADPLALAASAFEGGTEALLAASEMQQQAAETNLAASENFVTGVNVLGEIIRYQGEHPPIVEFEFESADADALGVTA